MGKALQYLGRETASHYFWGKRQFLSWGFRWNVQWWNVWGFGGPGSVVVSPLTRFTFDLISSGGARHYRLIPIDCRSLENYIWVSVLTDPKGFYVSNCALVLILALEIPYLWINPRYDITDLHVRVCWFVCWGWLPPPPPAPPLIFYFIFLWILDDLPPYLGLHQILW